MRNAAKKFDILAISSTQFNKITFLIQLKF